MEHPTIEITQDELREISELQREVAVRNKRLEELKVNVKAMLLSHIRIQPGRFDAKLRKFVSRSVPWKSLVIERLGQSVADWFKKLYPPHVRFEIEVVEHAVLPLWKDKEQSIDVD